MTEWVNSFRQGQGKGKPHRPDGFMAGGHTGPAIGVYGWDVICEKPDE